MSKIGIDGARVDRLVVPIVAKGVPELFAKQAGIRPEAVVDTLSATVGDSGAAQVLRGLPNVRLVESSADELRDVDRPEDLADVAAILRTR